jgi:hypothetical protein
MWDILWNEQALSLGNAENVGGNVGIDLSFDDVRELVPVFMHMRRRFITWFSKPLRNVKASTGVRALCVESQQAVSCKTLV